MKEKFLAIAGPLVGVTLFSVAIFILHRELSSYRYGDLLSHLRSISNDQIGLAVLATAGSYLSLTCYDALALRWIGSTLPYRQIALASFIAYVFSHNVGLSLLGGSAVRFRMFTTWGIRAGDVARIIPFNAATFWLGFVALSSGILVTTPIALPDEWSGLGSSERPVGFVLLALLLTYAAQTIRADRKVKIRGIEVELPGPALTAAQIVVSCVDWSLATAVFAVLLPASPEVEFTRVLAAFLLAQVAGVISQVPAGLGVFETVMILLLTPEYPASAVLGAALAYRLVYYLFPLGLGVALFASFELSQRRGMIDRAGSLLAAWTPHVIPRLLTVATFCVGVVLLLSGATPAVEGRIQQLARFVPLPVLELSHLLASLVGAALLLLARAMQRRIDAAYPLTLALLGTGALLSLLKGFDWEEALILAAMFAALLPCRRFFYRSSSLLDEALTPGWIASLALVFVGIAFVVLVAYRHVEYSNELWWQFEFDAHAPRALRAYFASALLLAVYGLFHLARSSPPRLAPVSDAEIARARAIALRSASSSAHLALLGDKQLLFADDAGFVMYGVSGACWIAMGDPIGPPDVRRDLAWRFHELVDLHGGLTTFYEVGSEDLPLYLDLGLTLHKLGEEARVPVSEFSLEGGSRKGLRNVVRRMDRDGFRFEVIPVEGVPAVLDDVAAVSKSWLARKNTREKRFSLGYFDPVYVSRTPLAVVRRGDRIVAFANLWAPNERDEFSVDLMRYGDDAPAGVMDFLFSEALLWGKAQGYAWFSLGMAPLSGLEHHRLAPLWNRVGALMFRHGENFYNFRGLRSYKEKFDPLWEPRYLASTGRATLPLVLTHVARLVSGGVLGIVRK